MNGIAVHFQDRDFPREVLRSLGQLQDARGWKDHAVPDSDEVSVSHDAVEDPDTAASGIFEARRSSEYILNAIGVDFRFAHSCPRTGWTLVSPSCFEQFHHEPMRIIGNKICHRPDINRFRAAVNFPKRNNSPSDCIRFRPISRRNLGMCT
jgi:hypothetical protein